MTNKIFRVFLFFAIGGILGLNAQILACSCVGMTSCEAFNQADVVFVGKVIGSKEQKTVEDYGEDGRNSNTNIQNKPKTTTYDVGEIYFEVQESFLGSVKGSRVTIHSNTGGGDCGYWFQRGEKYLVYARTERGPENVNSKAANNSPGSSLEPDSTKLWTSICSGTSPLAQAKTGLEYLRNLSAQSNGKIFGNIRQTLYFDKADKQSPFANLILDFKVLDGGGGIFTTKTDLNGKYEVQVPPGKYKIIPRFPDYARLRTRESNQSDPGVADVKADGCEKVDLTVENNSEIRGKVTSNEGKPLKGIVVELIDAESKGWASDGESGDDGTFLIPAVPSGRYILAINRNISPYAESPFPTYFYPGSSVMASAQVLEVGLGQKIENVSLKLPPSLEEQTISGIVVWADGKPATKTRIELADIIENTFFRKERVTETDAEGKFILRGFVGRSYSLKATYKKYDDLTEENAREEMARSGKITLMTGADSQPRYVRVTAGEGQVKTFEVPNRPLYYKIILKEE